MSNTKLKMKFENGDVVTHEDFGQLVRVDNGADLITLLEELKENDAPIVIDGDDGFSYRSSGKDLVSVEIVL